MSDEEARALLKQGEVTSRVTGAVILVIGWAVAYLIWPSGAIDMPLASVSVLEFLRMLASGAVALLALYGAILLWI